MPPKITQVKWSAQNIPYGMEFSEVTGTFFGKPEVAGEYTVPVTVETNYGKDTKDVKILVKNGYGRVYIVGYGVNEFAIQDSTPDEYGFYPVAKLPDDVIALSRYPIGFRAHTTSGDVYGPSMGKLADSNVAGWIVSYTITKRSDVAGITYGRHEYYRYGNYGHNFYFRAFASYNSQKRLTIKDKYYDFFTNGATSSGQGGGDVNGSSVSNVPVLDIGTYEKGIRWLSADGMQDCRKEYVADTDGFIGKSKILTTNLGYKAVRLFSPAPFNFLSEDMLLDNNPDNFPYGIIKDAWGYEPLMYVQTANNQLYEYTTDSGAWNLLGTYDIKKIEVQKNASMLMLTNDGRLFHKGNNLMGGEVNEEEAIVPQHETLTHIYPSQYFIDFTFSQSGNWGNDANTGTLSVLRE